MGLKVINPLIKAVVKAKLPYVTPKVEVIEVFGNSCKQTIHNCVAKLKTKFFTKSEMLDMKPSEFNKIIEARTDISEEIRTSILSPEELNLYDEVVRLEAVQKMEPTAKESFLNKLFNKYYKTNRNETSAQLEVMPALIKKGYSPEILAGLPINQNNKDIVETILKRTDLPEKYAKVKAFILGDDLRKFGGDDYLAELRERAYCDALKWADKNNYKYIDECMELTGSFENLPYWTKDTSKIIREFYPDAKKRPHELFDRLYRNGHNYESVKRIFGDKQMTNVTQRLLEYKDFNKFKDIGLDEFDKLSVADKKEFIKGYISALTPKELKTPRQCGIENCIEELQNSMEIYRDLNTETLVCSYYNTLRSLLNKLPESERKLINSTIDTKYYRRQYRLDNPIPSLVDELNDVLKIETRSINGKSVKYAEMSGDVEFGISTHRFPCPESILTIEALEEVDPKMLLCVGTKGGSRPINVGTKGHALIVKPRKASDWHVQAYGDIDSGNNAEKNIYNFEHIVLNSVGNYCGAVDWVQNAIKKELNLSQREYTSRMEALKNCRTLGEIGKKDPIMEKVIRKVIKEQRLYEGLMRTETMGVTISENMPLENVSEDIINYCIRRDIPLVRVMENKVAKNPVSANIVVEV